MKMKRWMGLLGVMVMWGGAVGARPNIVFLMVDDWGWQSRITGEWRRLRPMER